MNNGGNIAANNLKLSTENITNTAGRIEGQNVNLNATNDLQSIQGLIKANGTLRTVKFDGLDGDVVIDRKVSVVTTDKAKDQALRQSEALSQKGLTARWEVPTEAQGARAQKMFEQLGIKNITVKVLPQNGQ